MAVALIQGLFIVTSKTNPDQIYKIGKDMKCQCKGFQVHKHCRHQQEVVDYIESGKTINVAQQQIIRSTKR